MNFNRRTSSKSLTRNLPVLSACITWPLESTFVNILNFKQEYLTDFYKKIGYFINVIENIVEYMMRIFVVITNTIIMVMKLI